MSNTDICLSRESIILLSFISHHKGLQVQKYSALRSSVCCNSLTILKISADGGLSGSK